MILLQTLVMAVILSMIAVMVMEWVLGRFLIAARTYRSATTKVHAQGYSSSLFSVYNFNAAVPVNGNLNDTTTDSKSVTYSYMGGNRYDFRSDEDQ